MKALDAVAVQAALRGGWGRDLQLHGQLRSTQDAAAVAASQGAGEGCTIVAESQSAGRGRWGKTWQDAPGASLLFTVLVEDLLTRASEGSAEAPREAGGGPAARVPGPSPADPGTLPLVLGLATVQALRALGSPEVACKWPNDVVWRGRKLGGLLVESRGAWLLAGCGLNLSQAQGDFAPDLRATAASLAMAGLASPREAVLAAVLDHWQAQVAAWRRHGFGAMLGEWAACDALAGASCRLRQAGAVLEGLALGVTSEGALRLRLADGEERHVHSAEVEQVRPNGPQ